jgi:aspartate racemase
MEPLIGILGGMGPLATVDLMNKIVEEAAASRDQGHAPVVTWNVPQVPDRQQALMGCGESPVSAMLNGIAKLNLVRATRIAIACNTAHYWFDELSTASKAPIIHIADATLDMLAASNAIEGPVGLVATRGTLAAGFYQARFGAREMQTLTNTESEIDEFFVPGCYAIKRGEYEKGGQLLQVAAEHLIRRGATTLVLACSEVPIAFEKMNSQLMAISVDPNRALARACVSYWRHCGIRPMK